jgi:hypothetical protein
MTMTMTEEPKSKREISTIAFPYVDLQEAIAVARAMLDRGGSAMERDQMAAALGLATVSGTFNNKMSAARMFGLIDNAQGRYLLTDLGFEILDPARAPAAMIEAFLSVPLYRRTYEEFRGRQLPPRPLGLEQAFVNFGVSAKQKDKARHAFDRSARTANFYPTPGEDRLVAPVIAPFAGKADSDSVVPSEPEAKNGAPIPTPTPAPAAREMHPFIEGLLDELPSKGQKWALDEQAHWLRAAAQIFRLLYKDEAGGEIGIIVTYKPGSKLP